MRVLDELLEREGSVNAGNFSRIVGNETLGALDPLRSIIAYLMGIARKDKGWCFGLNLRLWIAAEAREVPWPMQIGMGALALACVALGVVPSLVVPVLGGALAGRGGLPADLPIAMPALALAMPATAGVIAPAVLAGGLALIAAGVVVAVRLGADRRLRVGDIVAGSGASGRQLSRRAHHPVEGW